MKPAQYKKNNNLIARKSGNKTIILDPKEVKVYTLNAVTSRIWQILWKPRSITDMVKIISKEFEVSPSKAQKDMEKLINTAVKHKIIHPIS